MFRKKRAVWFTSSVMDNTTSSVNNSIRCTNVFHIVTFDLKKDGSTVVQSYFQYLPYCEETNRLTRKFNMDLYLKQVDKKPIKWYDQLTEYLRIESNQF